MCFGSLEEDVRNSAGALNSSVKSHSWSIKDSSSYFSVGEFRMIIDKNENGVRVCHSPSWCGELLSAPTQDCTCRQLLFWTMHRCNDLNTYSGLWSPQEVLFFPVSVVFSLSLSEVSLTEPGHFFFGPAQLSSLDEMLHMTHYAEVALKKY